jgi:hypothetical protein
MGAVFLIIERISGLCFILLVLLLYFWVIMLLVSCLGLLTFPLLRLSGPTICDLLWSCNL